MYLTSPWCKIYRGVYKIKRNNVQKNAVMIEKLLLPRILGGFSNHRSSYSLSFATFSQMELTQSPDTNALFGFTCVPNILHPHIGTGSEE